MSKLQENVRKLISMQITFAGIMSVLAFVFGLVYREVSRGFFKNLTIDQQLLYGHDMSLVHGHTFLLGAVIPTVLAVFIFMVSGDLTEKRIRNMTIRFKAYMVAASATLLLMVYKGLAFIVAAGQPLEAIDSSLFFGSPLFRGILFGLSHITLFWAVGEIVAGVIITLNKKPETKH